MISSIHLQNFRNHKDTEIEFGRLTALVGPNSAGKSNVLEAIRCFTRLPEERTFGSIFRGYQDPEIIVRNGYSFFRLEIEGEQPVEWSIGVKCTVKEVEESRKSKETSYPRLSWGWKWGEEDGRAVDSPKRVVLSEVPAPEFEEILARTSYLKAIAENLSDPSAPQEVPPKLHTNGTGLASVISYLKTTEPNRCDRLVRQLQDIVPDVEGLRTRPKIVRQQGRSRGQNEDNRLDELLYDMRGGKGIPAHSVSEGTLVATGLLAALIGNEEYEPHFLMVDDLEQGLHPKAQRELVDVLRTIQEQQSPLQVVFTTHSPYIVDELEPEEVWLLNTDAEGIAHAHRLSEHPDAERSLQVLTTGEFWSAEGEGWVVEDGSSDEASAEAETE